jgi:hypothetical protein
MMRVLLSIMLLLFCRLPSALAFAPHQQSLRVPATRTSHHQHHSLPTLVIPLDVAVPVLIMAAGITLSIKPDEWAIKMDEWAVKVDEWEWQTEQEIAKQEVLELAMEAMTEPRTRTSTVLSATETEAKTETETAQEETSPERKNNLRKVMDAVVGTLKALYFPWLGMLPGMKP